MGSKRNRKWRQLELAGTSVRRFLIAFGFLLVVGVALLTLFPTFLVGLEGGFKWRQVSVELSPDGGYQLVVSKRTAFPANELVDPSIMIRVELSAAASGRVIGSAELRLIEDSDLSFPKIEWRSNEVCVSDFDSRQARTITLKHGFALGSSPEPSR